MRYQALRFTASLWLLAAIPLSAPSVARAETVQARIDASKTGPPISKYLYGQFLEHIGGIVNNGAGNLETR